MSHSKTSSPRALLIPDIHQNHEFLAQILEREIPKNFEKVVLMGDYFDAREFAFMGPESARKTARLICELEARLGNRLTLLWGNHDVPYFLYQTANKASNPDSGVEIRIRQQIGLAPELEATAEAVCEEWQLSLWSKLRPFVRIGRFVVSHAGIHKKHYPAEAGSIGASLRKLDNQWTKGMANLGAGGAPQPLMDAGEARGGKRDEVGGVTWLDWNHEFADDLPFGQIVGHTWYAFERRIGRSHCLDYGQGAYGVLGRKLVVRRLRDDCV
jgi:hypothetical protein